tara:strand:- start:65 stop:331 length:267 start_codon:yes stop_codon:yes gene_type:complete
MKNNSSEEKDKPSYTPLDGMRTNPLSTQPGGSIVTFVYEGYQVHQTNVKNPSAYIRATLRNVQRQDIKNILVNHKEVNWEPFQPKDWN